jgi:hypothetical protein
MKEENGITVNGQTLENGRLYADKGVVCQYLTFFSEILEIK